MSRSVLQVVEDTTRQHLLGEGDNISLNAKMFMAPHLASRSTSCLNLIHHQRYVPPLADLLDSSEELRTAMIISSFSLYWF